MNETFVFTASIVRVSVGSCCGPVPPQAEAPICLRPIGQPTAQEPHTDRTSYRCGTCGRVVATVEVEVGPHVPTTDKEFFVYRSAK